MSQAYRIGKVQEELYALMDVSEPDAVRTFRESITGGYIDGRYMVTDEIGFYETVGCLAGKLAEANDTDFDALLIRAGYHPRFQNLELESLANNIVYGDTPETNMHSKLALSIVDRYLAEMAADRLEANIEGEIDACCK
jgi:hypothetical protein